MNNIDIHVERLLSNSTDAHKYVRTPTDMSFKMDKQDFWKCSQQKRDDNMVLYFILFFLTYAYLLSQELSVLNSLRIP